MKRQEIGQQLIFLLQKLESEVKVNNKFGLTDINSYAEDFYCRLLNEIFDLNLKNINLVKLNFPAIDLADCLKRKSFQITSQSTKAKIKKTLERFDGHNLDKDYDSLDIVVITFKKTKVKDNLSLACGIPFNKDDNVLDLNDIVKIIKSLTPEKQNTILNILREELEDSMVKKNYSNEVQTLIDLVDYLTKNKKINSGTWTEEPDPENKIKHRFSEHSKYLENEIVWLLPLYSNAKDQVFEVLGLDSVNVEFIRIFLKTKSEFFLAGANGDPKKALDDFTSFLKEEISSSGISYDDQAIRFYLIDELIKCNVFPN